MKPSRLSRTICSLLAGSTLTMASAFTLQAATIDDTVKTTAKSGANAVSVSNAAHFDGDIRKLAPAKKWQPGDPIKVANPRHVRDVQTILPAVNKVAGEDPLLQKQLEVSKKAAKVTRAGVTELNFDGLEFNGVNPPDPTGEVGLKYYIQSINSPNGGVFNVYDKTDGALVAGPITMASLASGDCANSLGDPIILFDELANRWVLTEFSTPSLRKLCVLVSKTEDPVTGGWYAYEFEAPSFPDYPKYSQMGGVYYASANEGTSAIYAFEREKMLKGEPAAMIRQEVPRLAGFGFNSITPIDVDGGQDAPDGTPGLFIRHRDDELHNSGANNSEKDYLELWTLAPDFTNPDNTKVEGPFNIEIAEIDSQFECSSASYGCLAQKDTDQTLDPLREVVMYKGQYRKFGGHESIVGNLITKIGDNTAAIRWFELRRNGDSVSDWALHQEGTYSEGDDVSRYMGGAIMDADGNIGLAYMMTGKTKYPSIGYNGRNAADELGTLTFGEQILIEGTSHIASDRDGDYSHMSVDPVDHCTLWFTSEYGKDGGQWGTRISSFKVPSCGDPNPGFTLSANNLKQEVCASGDMAPITITASGYNAFDADIKLSYVDLPEGISGSFSSDTIKTGVETTASVSIAEGTRAGDYVVQIQGTSDGAKERGIRAYLKLMDQTSAVATSSPANEEVAVSLRPVLTWTVDNRASSYFVEIAMDENFTNVVAQGTVSGGDSFRPSNSLEQETTYYWRVTSANSCGEVISAVSKFITKNEKDGSTELAKGDASAEFGNESGELTSFYIDVPEGAENLEFTLAADNGDADLYIALGSRPETDGTIICRSESPSSNEYCGFEGAVEPGTYFAAVFAYNSFANARLTATYVGGSLFGSQNDINMSEDSSYEIQTTDINVNDVNYPDGYTLQVTAGEKYTVEGNAITPDANYYGELTVNATLSKGSQSEDIALKVTVANVNDAPVITGSDDLTVEEDGSFTVGVDHLTIEDVDNDDPTFAVTVTEGENYTVEGTDTVKPAENFNGALTVTVMVNDGEADSAAATVALTVTPVNDAPVLNADTARAREDSTNNIIDVLANDTDVDDGDTLTLVSVNIDGGGSASISDNKVSYTPAAGFSGTQTFEYTAEDSAGEQKSSTVTVTVNPKPDLSPFRSGGSMGAVFLLLLPLVAVRRFWKTR